MACLRGSFLPILEEAVQVHPITSAHQHPRMSTTRTPRSRRPAAHRRGQSAERGPARRVKLVWVSFLAAMTMVGGVLMALDDRPAPRLDGLSFAPLLASTSGS